MVEEYSPLLCFGPEVEVEASWHAAFAVHGVTIGLVYSFAIPLSLGVAAPAGTARAVG